MYHLGVKESTFFVLNASQPFIWLTLSRAEQELTVPRIRRAMLACCCRNPLLRGRYDPCVAKDALRISTPEEFVRLEQEEGSPFPVHVDAAFETRAAAWAEYVRQGEGPFWESPFTWELAVHMFAARAEPDVSCAIFATFNHGVADGLGAVLALKEFLGVLNMGAGAALPDSGCLGPSLPVPKPLAEAFPKLVFVDALGAPETEQLFESAKGIIARLKDRHHSHIEVRHFSKETTDRFVARCKAHGVTVGAAFTAIYQKAVGARVLRVLLPVNARDAATEQDVAPRFVSAGFTADFAGLDDVWDAAKVAGTHIKVASASEERWQGQALNIPHGVHVPPHSPVDHMRSLTCDDEAAVCMSNLGVIERRLCGDGKALRTWVPLEFVGLVRNQVSDGTSVWPLTLHGKLSFAMLTSAFLRTKDAARRCADAIAEMVEKEAWGRSSAGDAVGTPEQTTRGECGAHL